MEYTSPKEIEKKSFEIITKMLGDRKFDDEFESIIKRVIHTTADFDYADNLCFSKHAVNIGIEAIKRGADIVTDTSMTKSGINKKILKQFGGNVHCFIADENVAKIAIEKNMTRSAVSMEIAAKIKKPLIFAIGNAPTALIKIYELIQNNIISPVLVIGVPVGFVNVIESKELITNTNIPYIVSKGRKGGSNVAAAICNAILYKCLL